MFIAVYHKHHTASRSRALRLGQAQISPAGLTAIGNHSSQTLHFTLFLPFIISRYAWFRSDDTHCVVHVCIVYHKPPVQCQLLYSVLPDVADDLPAVEAISLWHVRLLPAGLNPCVLVCRHPDNPLCPENQNPHIYFTSYASVYHKLPPRVTLPPMAASLPGLEWQFRHGADDTP
jgi:hypothetical protein